MQDERKLWARCVPYIEGHMGEQDGEIMIFWDELPEACMDIVKGYKVRFLDPSGWRNNIYLILAMLLCCSHLVHKRNKSCYTVSR